MGDGERIERGVRGEPDGHRGLAEGDKAEARLRLPEAGAQDAVAVVGISCRVPGGPDPTALWELLRSGTSAISERPPDRGALDEEKIAPGARFGGFLERIDGFDCAFFGISPREAAAMDPQQRLMLELCWEALEDAAIPADRLEESQTGVFVGSISTDYADLLHESGPDAQTRHAMTGLHRSMIANRVSYTLGLRGPSMTVDTGQSSSLVAVHLACESLRSGESALALACGVHLNISSASLLRASRFGGLSPDGRCSTFDASANGYVRGEGGGVVVLKPLSHALAAGDRIYCTIRGSAVNNDGGGEGLTAPNRAAQEEVLRLAYERARVERSEVQYVELHGTGTVLGDRVEAGALGAVLGSARPADRPLPVGSVKTNIGHLEGAAGVVGLIKAALCVSHDEIPPSLNFQQASPDIPLQELGLKVQQRLGSWPQGPRLAGVSSFGLGGTNCHVVIGEPPHVEVPSLADDGPLGAGVLAWAVSGRGEPALRAQAQRLAEHLDSGAELSADAVGYSLATGRQAFEWRGVLLGADREELLLATQALSRGESAAGVVCGRVLSVGARPVFLFAGQGSQWEGMALELLDSSPVFAERMRACEEALGEYVEWSLCEVLRSTGGAPELDRLDVVQPVLFAVMVSLAALWRACGVHPAAVVGHSQGEIAAAYVAGALSLEDAARIVTARSEALKGLSGQGVMASIALSASEAESRIERWQGRVWVAAVNGPSSVVVSGDREALKELLEECVAAAIRVREIPAAVAAGHSPQVETLREDLLASLDDVRPLAGAVPFYSTVAGGSFDHKHLDADYWYRNLREPVQLEATVRALLGDGHRAFLEVSSHPLLTGGVQETVDAALGVQEDALVASTLRKGEGDPSRFLRSLATLWVNGVGVDWESVLGATHASRVTLPTYAFQRERHWLGARESAAAGAELAEGAPTPPGSDGAGEQAGFATAAPAGAPATTWVDSTFARRVASMPPRRRESVVLETVLTEAAVVLGYPSPDALSAELTFKELGFDSPAGVELRNRIAAATGLRLPTALAFDYPTPRALARHLLGELSGSGGEVGFTRPAKSVDEPIAIVGMSCRLPGGVHSPEDLWELVASGTDAISGFPTDRGWDLDALYDPDPDNSATTYAREGGFVYDAGHFDAAFFGISPREAMAMDPQQRLLLEGCWEAIEHAGLDPLSLKGSRVGVFAGSNVRDYNPIAWLMPDGMEGHNMTGMAGSVLSGRVAYLLGLQGPALTVDTACSSSLVSLHLACTALRNGECTLALASGVTTIAGPGLFVAFSRQRALARDGRCKSFADAADGTGWGEGVGVLLVERLSDARANGHRVLAVVRGSAVNQDGASNGLVAPNGLAQQQVIREALADARLSASEVDAVEAHGTGTNLGDPIEAHALLATYGQRPEECPLWLGSVKSNIGHTQAAAGVAGVIKMVMAMRHGALPRTLHVDLPSTEVDWSAGAISLLTEEVPWTTTGGPRRAGVSSYGISGTNAHVILEQVEEHDGETVEVVNDRQLETNTVAWVVSGRSESALRAQAERLRAFVRGAPDLLPRDIAHSLAGRSAFEHRAVVLDSSRDELLAGLSSLSTIDLGADQQTGNLVTGVARREAGTAFLFTGQGAQRVGMGRELYDASSTFKDAFDETCAHLDGLLGCSLREVVFGEGEHAQPTESGEALLDRTLFAQTGLFALEVGLFHLLQAWGVGPDFLIGHSVGELAAAHLAGVFSLEDACRLVAARGQLMGELPAGGAMVAVEASEEEVCAWLAGFDGRLSLAAINGPNAIVLSGEEDAVLQAALAWRERSRKTKQLRVSHAFHSARMDPMLKAFQRVAETVSFSEPTIPIVSNLTGRLAVADELCSPAYWVRHVREPVRFASGALWLDAQGVHSFLELGPDGVLSAMIGECLSDGERDVAPPLAASLLRGGRPEVQTLLDALARAWVGGVDVRWDVAASHSGRSKVELPTYAFQREHYWVELPTSYWRKQERIDGSIETESVGNVLEEKFWRAVEREDLGALADTIGVDTDERRSSLGSMLPVLSTWRRRHARESTLDRWRYRIQWKPLTDEPARAPSGLWLLLIPRSASEDPIVANAIDALEAHGARVSPIELDPGTLDRGGLVERIVEAGGEGRFEDGGGSDISKRDAAGLAAVDGVLSLLALDEERHDPCGAVPCGIAGTLVLAQALEELELRARLWVATRGAVSVGPSDGLRRPLQGMAWGLGRVVGLEQPGRWGGLIDLPDVLDERARSRLCMALAGLGEEDQLAVRASGIFARRLVRASWAADDRAPWKPRGTVLITGGTGGLGGHIARWLAGNGAECLLLASRRGSAAPGARELEADLRALGSRVRIVACDMADSQQLEEMLAAIPAEHPLDAVIHAAGVISEQPIGELTVPRLNEELACKADAALTLHELTAQMDLSAFVMFSSIAGTFGSGGQAAYAAANAFLACLAEHRRGLGLKATSIAWGAWAGEGMAAGASEQLNRRGIREMAPEFALAALQQALDRDESSLTVADLDWERYAVSYTAARKRPLIEEIAEVQSVLAEADVAPAGQARESDFSARLASLSADGRERHALDFVRAHTAAVLGYRSSEDVAPEEAFKELGLDSLAAVDLRNRLQKALGSRLPTTIAFDHPTPLALARSLIEEVVGSVEGGETSVAVAATEEPIAIVGMGCRFPGGVRTPEHLWELVASGGDAISQFPTDRGWDLDGVYDADPDHRGTTYTREGGFLHDAGEFDAGFFGISPREALAMSPQQRMLLEVCWEALERANIDPHSLKGTQTGVFAGESFSDYGVGYLTLSSKEVKGYLGTGSAGSVLSGRVSYTLGLEGPAMTVNTACSSSLVALHLALGALRSGECSLALAGGATVMATPSIFIAFSPQRGLAIDGRCKSFADAADGTSWSEGVGMVALERLSDAQRQGHDILAVVRGSAVNQDGASNGLTAPNGLSQQRVVLRALANAGLSPAEVDAVEAHGTGTRLGDPIEVQALQATYGQQRGRERPLWLGSVKSNVGHTQAAAGIAGVIKMVMALGHERLPRTLHVDEPSRQIDWSSGAISLLTEEQPWSSNGRPRRAGVSSFGISGTNAHVIIEEPPPGEAHAISHSDTSAGSPSRSTVVPWVVSARSEPALREQADRLLTHLRRHPDASANDVGLTLASRAKLEHRAVVLGADRDELLGGLGALADRRPAGELLHGTAVPGGQIAFLFTGQGAQHSGMGSELYEAFPVFAQTLDEVCGLLDVGSERALRELMFAAEGSPEAHRLNDTEFTQAALFAFEVALYRLVESWGLRADYVVGHSVGELAAAHVAGVFSLQDACTLVAARGRLMGALPAGGAMVAVQASEREMLSEIGDRQGEIALAAVNGPSSVVVSGEEQAVLDLAEVWTQRGRKTRRLRVSHAFHSARMDSMLQPFADVAAGIPYARPEIPIVSNLTGEAASDELCSADYWVRHVRETVRFADGIRWLDEQGVKSFIELGPDGALSAMAQECVGEGPLERSAKAGGAKQDESRAAASGSAEGASQNDADGRAGESAAAIPLLRAGCPEVTALFRGLASAHVRGAEVDWSRLFEGSGAQYVGLPTYAFQREPFWLDELQIGGVDAEALGQVSAAHPLLGAMVVLAGEQGWIFTGRLSLRAHPWLADHLVLGRVLFPGTAFLELALHGGAQFGCGVLRDLTLQSPLVLSEQGAVQLQMTVGQADDAGVRSLSIHSRVERGQQEDASADEWVCHAVGSLAPTDSTTQPATPLVEDGVWPPSDAETVGVEDLYDRLAAAGLDYGPAFQGLNRAWRREGEVFAEVSLPDGEVERAGAFGLHPALLDAALHAMALATPAADTDAPGGVHVPFSWNEVALPVVGTSALRVRLSPAGGDAVSLVMSDSSGRPVMRVGSLLTRSASVADLGGAVGRDGLFHVDWMPLDEGSPAPGGSQRSSWAVLGVAQASPAVELQIDGATVGSHADLDSFEEAIESGLEKRPDFLLLDCSTLGADGDPPSTVHDAVVSVLGAVQGWLERERLRDVRLAVVTRGAVAVGPGEDVLSPAGAAVWGLVRSAQSENPGRLVAVDIDGEPSSVRGLAGVLAGGEPQVAIRAERSFVPRLARALSNEALTPPPDTRAWHLDTTGTNTLEGLALLAQPDAERTLQHGEVCVGVRAGGVNFKDVLIALGMYPGGGTIGSEAAGVVLEVGPDVSNVAPGDRVTGLFSGAFGPVAITDSRLLHRIPDDWSFVQAASMPLVFLTAYYALLDLADIRPNERLLVHSAAGGVGMAAVQLARHMGVEVFATASAGKWGKLEELGLDAAHIASSRDLSFRQRFLDATAGRGVDVVLNSLAREFVDASLELLPTGGRFVEMGKTDVRDPDAVMAEHEGVAYRAFDLMDAGPARIQEMFGELMDLFERDALKLPPTRVWDVRRAPEALRFMSQAKHVGKIVLTVPRLRPDPRGTVLITGGTGGLGALLAKHLVIEHGMRNLLLVSRTGEATPGAKALAQQLADLGANVRIAGCDVADREQLRRLIGSVSEEHPLCGAIHAAGVLEDGVIGSLTPESVERVLAPKVDGAWHLHELLGHLDLDLFVLFSSVSATLGGLGQGNYAAGNAFLDALAAHRSARGLPAIAMAWGPWERASGMTSHLGDADLSRMASSGMLTLAREDGFDLFDAALTGDRAQVVLAHLDMAALRARARSHDLPSVLYGLVRRPTRRRTIAQGDSGSLVARFANAPRSERGRIVLESLRAHTSAVLGHRSSESLDSSRTFKELGFDSLAAIDLRNRLMAASELQLPATLIFDYPTLEALAAHVADEMAQQTTDPSRGLGLDIDQLQRTLSSMSAEEARRSGIADRLRSVLATWAGEEETTDMEDGDEDLESVTDDEIFELIDREFGVS